MSRARIVAARPPRASGRTTTIPFPPAPLPFGEHGRPGGGSTLLWPGGPLASPGHGGRGLATLPVTGAGVAVGCAVGCAVGWAVGRGVGWWGGRGVGTAGDGLGFVEPGVGVGATATIGPPVGAADVAGSPDGAGEGAMDGSVDGATDDGGGSEALPVLPAGVGEAAGEAGMTRDGDGAGVAPITAMS
jgi:hypothetical protein